MPDAELVCGVIEGRIDFAVLQRKYERKVYGRLYRLVRNHADTEELTQDVFVRLFEGLPSFDPSRACLCTWLYSITTNVVGMRSRNALFACFWNTSIWMKLWLCYTSGSQ